MSQKRFARFATTVVALFVVLSTLTVPVAATGDEGGLLGDDDDDGGLVDNTTDTVSDTVDSTTDTVSDTTGTDAVSDTTDTVDSTTDSVSGSTDTASTDAVSSDDLAFADMPDADSLVSSSDGGVPTDSLERSAGTGDLPVGVSDLPLDAVPVTGEDAPVQPEDSPYGSEGQGNFDACQLPADEQDLPLDSVPSPGELGVPTPPGVPIDLLTPQAAAGLVLGVPPRPCEAYDPHDPSVDPTEPAENGEARVSTYTLDAGTDGVRYVGGSIGEVDEFWGYSTWLVSADGEAVSVFDRTKVTDGRTRHYLFLRSDQQIQYRNATGEGRTRVGVLGRHVAFSFDCGETDLANASVNPERPQSSGPCEYNVDGLPAVPVGPDTVVGAIEEPPEFPGDPGIGDLPPNADSMVNL